MSEVSACASRRAAKWTKRTPAASRPEPLWPCVTAGVAEEAAFRGYMQTGIERHDRANALWITSLAFVDLHITQGIGAVLLLGPGLFAASMLYGMLAQRTGTILPGMAIHIIGDLAHVYFGVLRGDGSLLFVN